MAHKLLKNFSLYTIGQFLAQILSIILLPVYLKELSVEEYGIVASLMAVATFFNAIMQYGMGPTIMRYYYDFEEDPLKFKGFFTTILIFTMLSNIVLAILVFYIHEELFNRILPTINMGTYIFYVICYSFCFSVPVLNLSLFRIESKPVRFLLFNLFQFLISFCIIYYFLAVLKEGPLGKIKGEFYARIPLFIIGFGLFYKYISFSSIRRIYIVKALKYGIPLMMQSLIWWGLYRMDYFLISRHLGNEGVGLYNVGFQISFLLITMGISFSLAWTPHFFSIAKQEKTKVFYGDFIGNYFFFISFLGLAILLLYPNLLSIFNAEDYMRIDEFLIYLIIGAIFQSAYYIVQQLLFFTKKTIYIPLILGSVIVIVFFVENYYLKKNGLAALSVVKAIGFIIIFLLTYAFGVRYYSISLNWKKILLSFLFLIFSFFLSSILNIVLLPFGLKIVILLSLAAVIFFLGFLKKNEIKAIKKILNL